MPVREADNVFLQPPEELVGPNWSLNVTPTLFPSWPESVRAPEPPQPPNFLRRARLIADEHPQSAVALARFAQAAQSVGDVTTATEHARRALDLGLDQAEFGAIHAAMTLLSSYAQTQPLVSLVDDPRAQTVPVATRVRAAVAAGEFDAAQRIAGIESSPDALSVIAWVRTEQADFRGAISAGRAATRDGGGGVTLYANLAYAHAALGNHTQAIRLARQAWSLSSGDRRLGLGLAKYLQFSGKDAEAFAVLSALQRRAGMDIELALATAQARTDRGDLTEAHRVLQRIRASGEWAVADTVRRAELTANLALLRWITHRDKATSSLREILRALESCDYQSVGIANLSLNLMTTPEHADELARILGRLETRHPQDALLRLRMLLAILQREPSTAVEYARAWASTDLFNPFAAATAASLVGEVAGNFDEAVDIGLATLRRVPTDPMLLNNTAFVAAMAGRLPLARQLVRRALRKSPRSVYLTATQGLIDLLDGRPTRGRARYLEARRMAERAKDSALVTRVVLYAALAERAAGVDSEFGDPAQILEEQDPTPWCELPMFWIAAERLKRESRRPPTEQR